MRRVVIDSIQRLKLSTDIWRGCRSGSRAVDEPGDSAESATRRVQTQDRIMEGGGPHNART